MCNLQTESLVPDLSFPKVMESSLRIQRIVNGPFAVVGLGQVVFYLCHPILQSFHKTFHKPISVSFVARLKKWNLTQTEGKKSLIASERLNVGLENLSSHVSYYAPLCHDAKWSVRPHRWTRNLLNS